MPPFKAMYLIASKDPPKLKKKISADMEDFYHKCLQKNPENRYTAQQLLEHPFISKLNIPQVREEFVKFIKTPKSIGKG